MRAPKPMGAYPPIILGEIGYVQTRKGDKHAARELIGQLRDLSRRIFVDPYLSAQIHVAARRNGSGAGGVGGGVRDAVGDFGGDKERPEMGQLTAESAPWIVAATDWILEPERCSIGLAAGAAIRSYPLLAAGARCTGVRASG